MCLVTEPIDQDALDWLSQRADIVCAQQGDRAFDAALSNASGLIVRTYTTVDKAVLDHAPNLKVIGRGGVGLDNIDLEACRDRGITVVNTPAANRQAVVEYVTSILGHVLRPLPVTINTPDDLIAWRAQRTAWTVDRQMSDRTLGVLGLGAIGRRVAAVAMAIGMRVIHHDLLEIPPEACGGSTPVSADELFSTSDVLTIHVDGRSRNRGFVGEALLGRLVEGAVLINTSRGFVVDGPALARVLRQRPGVQAVLDVHAVEPIPEGDPLLGLSNAYLLPHLASRTMAAQRAMSWVVRDVWEALGSSC